MVLLLEWIFVFFDAESLHHLILRLLVSDILLMAALFYTLLR